MPTLIELSERLPVIISGGAGGIGSEVSKGLAIAGYQTFVILTREVRNGVSAEQRFIDRVRDPIRAAGGVEPTAIYADLTKPDEFDEGIDTIDTHLSPDQKVHYFALAATGLRGVRTSMGRIFVGLQRLMQAGPLTTKDLEQATEKIRQVVSTERGMQPAMQTNKEAAVSLFDELYQQGRFSKKSSVVNLSSSPTDDLIHGLKVNAFYDAIAQGKAGGEQELEERCKRLGLNYLKLIAPVISGTEVGDLSEELEKIVQAASIKTHIPKGTIDQVAVALLQEFGFQLLGRTNRVRNVYMGEDGLTYLHRPSKWPVPLLPYL